MRISDVNVEKKDFRQRSKMPHLSCPAILFLKGLTVSLARSELLNSVHSPPDLGTLQTVQEAKAVFPAVGGQKGGRDLTDLKGCMLLTIKDVRDLTGLGKTKIYRELAGPLASVRVGRRRLVPAEALKAWLASLRSGRG
jgi:excisionase family DNA binding protein